MLAEFDAVYEDGVLRPLMPLPLSNREQVRVTISRAGSEDWLDTDATDARQVDGEPMVTLEEVRAAMSKIRGSMDAAIAEDRGDY